VAFASKASLSFESKASVAFASGPLREFAAGVYQYSTDLGGRMEARREELPEDRIDTEPADRTIHSDYWESVAP
jgi:hypothetical protein